MLNHPAKSGFILPASPDEILTAGAVTERRDRAPALPQELDRAIYRVYTFDLNRHITARNEIDCANDAEATNAARQTLNGHDIEIWERDRFIAFMKSKASA